MIHSRLSYFLMLGCCFLLWNVSAQENGTYTSDTALTTIDTSRYVNFFNETDPFLEFAVEEEDKEFKKKKPKKKVFYGVKTKKGYTKSGYGSKVQVEVFHYIPIEAEPVPYVKDVFWFDLRTYEVEKGRRKMDPEFSRLLHGPYKRLIDGNVMETGVYYYGVRHARWEHYHKPKDYTFKDTIETTYQVLKDKQTYDHGWPEDSELTYYDKTSNKLKEAKPIVDGLPHGYYVSYYESGRMKEQGNYIHNHKAGTWIQYLDKGHRTTYRRIMIRYPRNPLKSDEKGQIIKEWNEEGKLIYDFEAEKRRKGSKVEKRFVDDETSS